MTERNIAKLVRASDSAVVGQVQHLFVVLNPDGSLQLHGSDNFVKTVNNNQELKGNLYGALMENVQQGEIIIPAQILEFPKLPCSPFSPSWKGSAMIRGVLTKMLSRIGYGGGGTTKKLGVGDPPVGWPENISWSDFSGATRSRLTTEQITEIILSMFREWNIDPAIHVKDVNENVVNLNVDNPDDPLDVNENLENIEIGEGVEMILDTGENVVIVNDTEVNTYVDTKEIPDENAEVNTEENTDEAVGEDLVDVASKKRKHGNI